LAARGGQIIDATIVSVPKQRNTKQENEAIKAGKTPEGWEKQPAKNAQKDKDARWTKKNDESFYGYKNHPFECAHGWSCVASCRAPRRGAKWPSAFSEGSRMRALRALRKLGSHFLETVLALDFGRRAKVRCRHAVSPFACQTTATMRWGSTSTLESVSHDQGSRHRKIAPEVRDLNHTLKRRFSIMPMVSQ
jgi:hypothetical protein